jgi:glutathione synthase/RimK-type ligase-like ATP-grasp enzyme
MNSIMSKFKASILRNEDSLSGNKWAKACEEIGIDFNIIDITAFNWMQAILDSKSDFYLLRPPGMLKYYKELYDERIYIINKIFGLKIFPSYEECYIYENKRFLSYFLQAQNIPHPKTMVFYKSEEAKDFISKATIPIVAKTSIGASGSGVQVIRDKQKAKRYIERAFSQKGIARRFGPNRVTGSPGKWFVKAVKSPSYFIKKLREYFSIYGHGERDFVIFQEYIPHDFEWRAVKIGDSFFAHRKIKYKDKASGSKGIEYVNPPLSILDFTRDLCTKNKFNFMAVDLFEDGKGGYLVNELQTIFGHVQDHIMEVNGKPGRYILLNNQWIFEEGDFNTNESYDLRLETAIKLYENE